MQSFDEKCAFNQTKTNNPTENINKLKERKKSENKSLKDVQLKEIDGLAIEFLAIVPATVDELLIQKTIDIESIERNGM